MIEISTLTLTRYVSTNGTDNQDDKQYVSQPSQRISVYGECEHPYGYGAEKCPYQEFARVTCEESSVVALVRLP